MTAATVAARQAALRQRRAEQGLARIEVWAHQDDHAAIKALVAQLARRREHPLDVVGISAQPSSGRHRGRSKG